jgi:hypothetical protein
MNNMKRSILVLLASVYGWCAMAQIGYYDAIALSNYVDPATHQFKNDTISLAAVCDILKNYCAMLPAETSYNNVIKAITTDNAANQDYNPIIAPYFGIIREGVGSVVTGKTKSLASSIGNLDVTSFADGLAKFLVARAQEELNVAFFRKFQDYLRSYPEVKVIFPATYEMVNQISAYQYATFLPALRSCFHQDMNAFSTNLIKLRNLMTIDCPQGDTTCQSRIKAIHTFLQDDPVGRTFVAGLLVSDNLIKGNNAVEILDMLANDEVCFEKTDNFSNSIRFVNLLSNSLRSTEDGELWVNKNQINKLMGKEDPLKLYLGLLLASDNMQPSSVVFTTREGEKIQLATILKSTNDHFDQFSRFRNNLKELGYWAAEVSLNAKTIRQQDGKENDATIIMYADYASAFSSLLKQGVTFFNAENPPLANDVHLFTSVLDNAVASCYDIKSENYTALVLHTSGILDTMLKKNYPFRKDYLKYGNFMANIIEADNSDEVKAAIDAAVLPVGSSSIKRETFSNISLNAYIGPMAGIEYLPGLNGDQTAPVVGVTAPLGIAFNWGNIGNGKRNKSLNEVELLKKSKRGGQSISLFIPLIDVGALATFRIGDDSSHVASEVELANIIAPGLYGYWGFGKVPVSIGIGGQIGPQLRKINAEDVNVDKNFYIRFGLNVVVDIPFFNFYTRN